MDPGAELEAYSEYAVHFFAGEPPELLRDALASEAAGFCLVDIGCGDGGTIYALDRAGLLLRAGPVVGVDLSPLRIARFQRNTGRTGIVGDGSARLPLAEGCADLVVSAMVVEHVQDDLAHVRELHRLLKPGGRLYLTTVIRKRGAWYFRRAPDGRRVLDPTHAREYGSRDAVEELLSGAGFRVERVAVDRLRFPIAHPLLRALHRWLPGTPINRVFVDHAALRFVERASVPIPRYRSIELVAVRP